MSITDQLAPQKPSDWRTASAALRTAEHALSTPETTAAVGIDLDAIGENWLRVSNHVSPAQCAAVIKADGYGIGALRVATQLWQRGCRTFFVARLNEAKLLRTSLPLAQIYIFDGCIDGTEQDMQIAGIKPVISSIEQLTSFLEDPSSVKEIGCAIHIDTGLSRHGITREELSNNEQLISAARQYIDLVISHLATSERPTESINHEQLAAFGQLSDRYFAGLTRSLANSGGCFLGDEFLFDMVRAGIVVHGAQPNLGSQIEQKESMVLLAKVLAVHDVAVGETVGYGQTYRCTSDMRLACLGIGYASGYPTSLSSTNSQTGASVVLGGQAAPVIGRVSMDLTVVDVSNLAPKVRAGDLALCLTVGGSGNDTHYTDLGVLAALAECPPHELLCGLGRNLVRAYSESVDRSAPKTPIEAQGQ